MPHTHEPALTFAETRAAEAAFRGLPVDRKCQDRLLCHSGADPYPKYR